MDGNSMKQRCKSSEAIRSLDVAVGQAQCLDKSFLPLSMQEI